MRIQAKWLVAAIVVFALQITNCRAEIYVFGDSLSDTGNFLLASKGLLPPSPPYYDGRFSNGPVWVEHFARAAGEPVPMPSILRGTNFAFNGSRAAGDSPYLTPDLTQQVFAYLLANGGTADPNDVFLIWAGANDILFGATRGEKKFIPNAIEGIRWSIEALHAAGARNIVILDLPALGQTPFFNTVPTLSTQLDAATSAFNLKLASLIRSLRNELRNVKIADVKISYLFQSITRAPRLFGLQNVTDSATEFDALTGIGYTLRPGVDANRYLFWDSVHPTAQVHKIIAAYGFIDYKLNCLRR